ncbi:ABC transporter substrate-binding protein [Phycicoccus endophyticus]|uniref:ABC transporter substrate-binding protein n=1 Tax=Phycicoccus endophyticus TaxID=1690220 RepID=A0A7G9QZQ2_9MICO|nr:ABC transporter substrate-binding protein [Phycicoccus endophyticus]NHI20020.1 ABC transporter substrate-binding protein [Phycicoccus endophyticus]QNN48827.1 ABC transporter substrate-binding protein [Phycicoccus endophyticus]GGL42543.1 peptide ABC transporter substrate-binding protein [Phycicoccus endophyticus]
MTRKLLKASTAAAACAVTAVTLAACGTGADGGGDGSSADPSYVSGGTFTVALNDDPGNLSPLTGVSLVQRALVPYAYESLVYTTSDGEALPWLAESWTQTPTSVTYTLKDGVTCSDGSEFTAETAAHNIAYQADGDNGTFWHNSNITEDMTASADGNTLTITSTTKNPFLLTMTGEVEMVCQKGLDDPGSLKDSTDGTALFHLTSLKAGNEYTYTKRTDYTWGPQDVTSETEGLPDTIVGKVVTDESTAANLLLSGGLNAAGVAGTDRDRLESAGLESQGVPNPIGEMLFNERSDRPTADERVRQALTVALDRASVGDLVTNGHVEEMTSLVVQSPFLCVAGGPKWTLPDPDAERAGELLDEAGYTVGSDGMRAKDGTPLTIRFLYDAGTPSHAAAAEEVQAEWKEIGVDTELVAEDPTGWSTDLYQSYDWDTGFIQLAPGTPVVLSLFFLGDTSEQGGYNFMDVQNTAYNDLATQAMSAPDADAACDLWQSAEKELVDRVDVYPLAQTTSPTFFTGATADVPWGIAPTTIRMLG